MEKQQKDMKKRIQETALKLFAKQGYEKTSLREIAERLDITKAAIYYHFQSKEDILRSIAGDIFGAMEELLAWAESEPATEERRREFLQRFADLSFARLRQFIPFAIANLNLLQSLQLPKDRAKAPSPIDRIRALFVEPGSGVEDEIRSNLALMVVFLGASRLGGLSNVEAPPEQIERIVVSAAIGLLPPSRRG